MEPNFGTYASPRSYSSTTATKEDCQQRIGIIIQVSPPEQVQPRIFHQGYYVSISSTPKYPPRAALYDRPNFPFRVRITRIRPTVSIALSVMIAQA